MKLKLLLLLLLWGEAAHAASTNFYTYIGGGTNGNWNVSATWTTDPTGSTYQNVGALVPGGSDFATILNGYTVTLTANVTEPNLGITIAQGGVLELGSVFGFTSATKLRSLGGQGTLRVGRAYFPAMDTNDFDDANTGTVEYYNWAATDVLPQPASTLYNNLRLINTTASAYTAKIDFNTTLNGTLTLAKTGAGAVNLNFGSTINNTTTFTVNGDITVGAGTTLGVTAVNGTYTLTANASLLNSGAIKLYISDAQTTQLVFGGATDESFACNGPTDLGLLTVNKGANSAATLDVTATVPTGNNVFTPFGLRTSNLTLNSGATVNLLTLTHGIVKLGSNINLPRLSNITGNYDIGTSAISPTLWIAGATVSISNTNALVVYGTYRITAGVFTSNGTNGAVIREDGRYIIEGGTTTVTKFRPSNTATTYRGSFSISGGTFNATGTTAGDAGYARFSLPYPGQSFQMSGGTIVVSSPEVGTGASVGAGLHIGVLAANADVTGGTIAIQCPASSLDFVISSTAPFWDLTITKLGAGASVARLDGIGNVTGTTTAPQPLVIQHDLTLSGLNTSTLNANSQNVTVQGNFVVNSGAAYTTGTNTTFLTGGANQLFTNNNATSLSLYNLTINKSAGVAQLSGTATSVTVTNTLSLLTGVFSDGGKTVNAGGTSLINSATHLSLPGGSITLDGMSNQTISGNGAGVFGNLTINSGVTPLGEVAATLAAAVGVAGTLTLQSEHVFDIETYRLSLTDVGTNTLVAGTGGFSFERMLRTSGRQSDGGLSKTFGSFGGAGFTYAVGIIGKYTPATVTLNVAPTTYGQIIISPSNAQQPFVQSANVLQYYWKVRSTGFGTIKPGELTLRFSDDETDVVGTETSYVPGYYVPGTLTWTVAGTTADVLESTPAAGRLTANFNAISYLDGEYTAGVPAAFGPITIYYSRLSGPWTTASTWSTTGHGGVAAVGTPTASNPVFVGGAAVGEQHTVTVGTNVQNSGSLVIASGSVLDVGTTINHNFGALPDALASGQGTLRISSSTTTAQFPGGDFGPFLGALGGTVEYYTNNTVSFSLPIISYFSSLSLATYNYLVLNPASGRVITLPNTDLHIYGNLSTGTPAIYTGFAQLSPTAASSNIVTVDGNLSMISGTLRYNPSAATAVRGLVVGGDVLVGTGATFTAAGTGNNASNSLTVSGNLTNNGAMTFNGSATTQVNLTFMGAADKALAGTGTTSLYNLTLNKGTSLTPTLTVSGTGTLTTPANSWFTLASGTLSYEKAATLNIHTAVSSAYTIPQGTGLTVNNSGATVYITDTNNAAADLLLAGQLRVLQGAAYVGLAANTLGNDIEYAGAGIPRLEVAGGQLNVNGKIRRGLITTPGSLSYEQSGGVVDIAGLPNAANQGRGLLEVLNDGSSFTMSGGTLALHRTDGTTVGDLYLDPATSAVTGGTVVLGNTTASNYTIAIDSQVPLYNLRVEPNSSGNNFGILRFSPLTLLGSLQIGSGAVPANDNRAFFQANGLDLAIGQNLANYNISASTTVAAGGYQPGTTTQTTTFNGLGMTQNLLGAATNVTAFGNLTLRNVSGLGVPGSLLLDPTTSRDIYVNGTLTLSKGTLNDNGRTISAVGPVANSATHTGTGELLLSGATNQVLSGDDTGKFGNLRLSNTNGATATANQEVTGVLTLTSGFLDIGSQLLSLSNTSALAVVGSGTNRYIRTNGVVADQGVRKAFPVGANNFTFPVGVAGKYTPAQFNVTANPTVGTLTVRPVNVAHPAGSDQANALAYYWKATSTGFAAGTTVTHAYSDAEIGSQIGYVAGRFVNSDWIPPTIANTSVSGHQINFTGVNYFDGDYTSGLVSNFVPVVSLYSRNATAGLSAGSNWTDVNSWTTTADGSGPTAGITPTAINPTTILSGHLITISTNGRSTTQLTLNGTGTLDLGTFVGHNFNTVTGSGTLRVGSAVFPAGNYEAFVAATTGGTVDYTAAVLLPARSTYNNLSLTGGPLNTSNAKTLANVNLHLNGQFLVGASTTVTNPDSRDIILTSATLGVVLNGSLNLGDGALTVPASLANNANTLIQGAGAVTIGQNLTSIGTITGGNGTFQVGGSFSNSGASGIFTAGTGAITVGTSFSNSGSYTAAGNLLTVGGNITNSGTFGAGASQLDLSGNFTSSSGTFTAGTSLVRLLGSNAPRTITGPVTFYDLQKLNTGGDLTLASDVTVTDQLTLGNGKILTGTNTLLLTNSATATPLLGTSSTSYVQGVLAITFPNTANAVREFAVGNGGAYRPVTVRQTSGANPQVLVEMINSRPPGTVSTPLTNLSRLRYYRIQLLAGSISSPIISLPFNNDGQNDEQVSVPGNLRIASFSGTPISSSVWTNVGGSGAFSPSAPAGIATVTTAITSNTLFALASTNVTDNPLPVELTSFTATPVGPAVQVAWTTASEKNSDYFAVQRSANGLQFEDLSRVAAQGTSSQPQTYGYRDARPLTGTSYYRLRQADLDGSSTYGPVVAVRFGAAGGAAVATVVLYPNPNKGDSFRLSGQGVPAGGATVRIFDLQGRLIGTHTVDFAQAADAIVTPARRLPAGTYLVRIETPAGRFTQRLVVE